MTPQRGALILLRLRQAVAAGALILTIVWGWNDWGVFRTLAELQTGLFGAYSGIITALITFLLLLLAGLVAAAGFTKLLRHRFSAQQWVALKYELDTLQRAPIAISSRMAWTIAGLMVLAPLLVFWGAAAYFPWAGYSIGPLVRADIASLTQVQTAGRYLE